MHAAGHVLLHRVVGEEHKWCGTFLNERAHYAILVSLVELYAKSTAGRKIEKRLKRGQRDMCGSD